MCRLGVDLIGTRSHFPQSTLTVNFTGEDGRQTEILEQLCAAEIRHNVNVSSTGN